MNTAKQGTEQWHKDRMGKVTASRFKDVMTQPRSKADKEAGKLSATARSYMLDLLAEHITGEPQGFEGNKATEWGNLHEYSAVAVYENLTGLHCEEVGFVDHPTEKLIGGSPDRLIGTDGGLEIKCPFNTRIHLGYLLDGVVPKDHVAQVQGHIWINECDWWDFGSYDPRIDNLDMALFKVKVYRDEAYIAELENCVLNFRDQLVALLDKYNIKKESEK